MPVSAGSSPFRGVTLAVYGNGSDGAIIYDVDTTLTDDVNATSIVVNAGVTVTTAGFRLLARQSIINHGVIKNDGVPGAGQASDFNINGGTTTPGGRGGDGSDGAGAGQSATGTRNSTDATTFVGGAGGNAGANSGGSSGSVNATGVTAKDFNNVVFAMLMFHPSTFTVQPFGGGLGGGGGACASASPVYGGAGGGGGGGLVLSSKIIDNTDGVIQCKGGNGADANGSGNAGGGGGGGGGFLVLIGFRVIEGSLSVAGGIGGAKVGTGTVGGNGNAGLQITVSDV